ncbi:MAG: hypothetical protein KDB00_22005 [Planctomycetales bacterium]|nr:hypothetical protein [Planctomycetales bacterium]
MAVNEPAESSDDGLSDHGPSDHGPVDEGPGCMPAILAVSVLMGIVGFIFCGFMTWLIFQKQDVLALRSMRGSYIPAVEQSLLAPEEKARTVKLLSEFADNLQRGRYEGWQASGVMQRMSRLPVLQWGQIRRVEKFVIDHADEFGSDDATQFVRLRKGVEQNKITTLDFSHILSPVLQNEFQGEVAPLVDTLDVGSVKTVVQNAKVAADRAEIDGSPRDDVELDTLVRRQIEAGIQKGTY